MKKVNIVLFIVLIVLVSLYCCGAQPEKAVVPAQPNTPSEPQPEPEKTTEANEPLTEPWPEEEKEIEEPPPVKAEPVKVVPLESPSPEEIAEASKTPLPEKPIVDKSETVTEETDPIIETPLEAPVIEEPLEAPSPPAISYQDDFFSSFSIDSSDLIEGERGVVITNPKIISYYESQVLVTGSFTGFRDITTAGWEIEGTDRNGKLSLNKGSDFSFQLNTSDLSDTQVLRIFAEDSAEKTAEGIIILMDDGIGPEIRITAPSNNSIYNLESVIKGTISGEMKNAVIEFIGGGIELPVETDSGGHFSINIAEFFKQESEPNVLPYNPVFKLIAEDNNHDISTEYLSLFNSSPGSGISIKSPRENDLFDTEIIIEGTAEDYRELSWDIVDTGFSGIIQTDNGKFSYPLQLSGLGDRIIIRISGKSGDTTETATIRMFDSRKTPSLNLTEPLNGGYYTELIPLKGRAGDEGEEVFSTVKSISWGIPGTENINNLIFFEEDGSFTIDLSLRDYNGLLPLELKLEDYNNNFNRQLLLLKDGKKSPEIKLTLPKSEAEYGAFIDIAGIIRDPYAETSFGGIEEASYEILSTDNYEAEPITGKLELYESNTFGTQIPSYDIKGNQQLIIEVTAKNGNSVTKTIDMEKSVNDITSFDFKAEESRLTADWRPILATEARYSLLLTNDGSDPTIENSQVFRDVTPPLVLEQVENGKLYSAKLLAETELGNLESGVLRSIPAGPDTFRLKAKGAFKQIQLTWNNIPGSDTYSIFRTDDSQKSFTLLTTGVFGEKYIDKEISYGREYYYYITPENHEYARSGYAGASMQKAPDERIVKLNKLSDFSPVDIDVVGNYVYTAAGDDGLFIVDITSPESLSITGSMNEVSPVAVNVRGDYAYLACGVAGLNIVSILDPGLPVVTGRRTTTDASDVCLKNDYAYVADNEGGIKIIDIKDSRNPERIATIPDILSSKLFLTGNLLVSNHSSGVIIFDITEPDAPKMIAEYPYPGVKDIIIADDIAYLLSDRSGLIILDISSPENPELLSTYNLTAPESLTVSGNFIYVAAGRNGLKIIDISSRKNPKAFDSLRTGNAKALDISGEHVIIAETTGLTAIQTFLQGVSFIINKLITAVTSTSVALYKTLSFIPAKEDGLITLDVSSPASPIRLNPEIPFDYAGEIEIDGENLYISTAEDAVALYEISLNQSMPVFNGPVYTVDLSSPVSNMNINVSSDDEKLLSVCTEDGTISFIRNGTITGTVESIEGRDCFIKGQTIFISDNRAGLMIYSTENETGTPELISSIEIERADFLLSYNNYLLVAGRKGISFFDITDPETPVETGMIKTNYAENGVINGKYLYLAEGYKGLLIYDLSDPLTPVLASICDTVYASDLVIMDDYAFITDGTGFNTVQIFIPDWIN